MVNEGKSGAAAAAAAKPKSTQGPTKCACGEKGDHYAEKAMEAVFPSTPESIYNLMFPSQFIREFMSENQKLTGMSPLTEANHAAEKLMTTLHQISKCPTGRPRNPALSCSSGTSATSSL